jgi:phage shock protein E
MAASVSPAQRSRERSLSMRIALALSAFCLAAPLAAQPQRNPQIDYPGFQRLAAEVSGQRDGRLISHARFREMARSPYALILDARSRDAFAAGHIQGAVNLPFTDFTAESLAAVIGPDRDRPILIYCNNNFRNNVDPVPRKLITVALNIQTFINLVGYGYRNVYELGDVVDFNDPLVGWVRGQPLRRNG